MIKEVSKKTAMRPRVIVHVKKMLLVLHVLEQFPMPLLRNVLITQGYLILALFPILSATWPTKMSG